MISNLIIDPFNIFHTGVLKYQVQQNERYQKIEFLKHHKNKFDTLMLGNSRIGTTDPVILEQYLPDGKVYNMGVSSANTDDYLKHLKYFIKDGYSLKTIYLQIDYQDMMYWGHSDSNYLQKYHPDVTDQNMFVYFWKYLTITPVFNMKIKLLQNITPDNSHTVHDFEGTGMWFNDKKESAINRDPEAYIKQEASFHLKLDRTTGINPPAYKKMLKSMRELTVLCDRHNIRLILFTAPLNHTFLDSFYIEDMLTFLEDISRIHNYWFFSDYNSLTCNNSNYYEASHYRDTLAKSIAARIFQDNTANLPDDFGLYIQQNQFKQYREQIRENLTKACSHIRP